MSHRAHRPLFQKQKFVVQKHVETYAVLFRLIEDRFPDGGIIFYYIT